MSQSRKEIFLENPNSISLQLQDGLESIDIDYLYLCEAVPTDDYFTRLMKYTNFDNFTNRYDNNNIYNNEYEVKVEFDYNFIIDNQDWAHKSTAEFCLEMKCYILKKINIFNSEML